MPKTKGAGLYTGIYEFDYALDERGGSNGWS